jgi:hypothetical protein
MTYPDSPQVTTADGRVLMIALVTVGRYDQSGQLPPVQAGEAFFVVERDTAGLVANGQAAYAPVGTPLPQPEPPWTVTMVPGLGRATSNVSH